VNKVNRESLLQVLELVRPGLSAKEIEEQSSCFVFKDGRVVTFNDEISCSHKSPMNFEGAVPAKCFLEYLQKSPDVDLDVEEDDDELILVGKKRRTGFTMEREIMLRVDLVEEPGEWKPLKPDFREAISIVEQCAGKDESKFKLTCVHITSKYIEAFDNYQMARYLIKVPVTDEFLVRRDAIKHIIALDMVELSETASWIHFRNSAGLIISCRRYDEKYPAIGKYLDVNGRPAVLPKGLTEVLERAGIFSEEKKDADVIRVEMQKGKVRIRGQGSIGWHSEVRKIKYEGPPLTFYIAPKLLADITTKYNQCEITSEYLKVSNGKFTYISTLSESEDNHAAE